MYYQRQIFPKTCNIPDFNPPRYYSVDGYTHHSYVMSEKKILEEVEEGKGTVFEVLGDYYHSNPEYYKPEDKSANKGMTHKQNYDHTMNRLKHIEDQGYKVFYIWVTDWKRYIRDQDKGNDAGKTVNLFDYINVEKKYGNNNADYSLLPKGSQKFLFSYNNINAAY